MYENERTLSFNKHRDEHRIWWGDGATTGMIIELVGLPGAGKTTFAKHLTKDAHFIRVSVGGKQEILFYNVVFLLRHPAYFIRGLWWVFHYRGSRVFWYTKFVNLFLVHNAKYMKARQYDHAVIDQGHHQNIIALFDEEVPQHVIRSYVQILPKPDVLCFFTTDIDVRMERLRARGYGAREEAEGDQKEIWENAREKNYEQLFISRDMLTCATDVITPTNTAEILQKISMKRPWYFVMHARMPTEKAHGLQIAKTIEALQDRGHYVSLLVPRRHNSIDESIAEYYGLRTHIPVRVFGGPDLMNLPHFLGRARFILSTIQFMLAVFSMRHDTLGVYYTRRPEIAWALRLKGLHVLYEAHSYPESLTSLFKFFLKKIDGIVTNSEGTRAQFIKAGFTDVALARNGADLDRFYSAPTQRDAQKELGFPPHKKIVMYVGAFYEWKGVPFLVRTWETLLTRETDAMLYLIGGTQEDLRKINAHISHEMAQYITVVPHVPIVQIPLYLAAADILVLPNVPTTLESINYTSPIKLFEYLASGRAIIASDLPSIREIAGENAVRYFHAGDGAELAKSITALLGDEKEREMLGRRGRELSRQYGWSSRAEKLESVVRETTIIPLIKAHQYFMSLMSGSFAAFVYFFTVYFCTDYLGFHTAISIVYANIAALITNFRLLRKIFSGRRSWINDQFFRYLTVVLLNLLLNEFATFVLVGGLHLWYMLAQFMIIGALSVLNFYLYRQYVFRGTKIDV